MVQGGSGEWVDVTDALSSQDSTRCFELPRLSKISIDNWTPAWPAGPLHPPAMPAATEAQGVLHLPATRFARIAGTQVLARDLAPGPLQTTQESLALHDVTCSNSIPFLGSTPPRQGGVNLAFHLLLEPLQQYP